MTQPFDILNKSSNDFHPKQSSQSKNNIINTRFDDTSWSIIEKSPMRPDVDILKADLGREAVLTYIVQYNDHDRSNKGKQKNVFNFRPVK